MQRLFAWLPVGVALLAGYSYYQNHYFQPKARTAEQLEQAEPKPDSQDPLQPTTVVGPSVSPLAEFMAKANPLQKTEEPPPQKLNPADHIAPSPVGTSNSIVHKTFAVTSTAQFLFEVPPHAASPQLHGTYHSVAKNAGVSSDGGGDVDLLLMDNAQYTDFLSGRPADVIYSVDSSHDQDVSFGLPATLDRPVQYYLIFRNSNSSAAKKVVQADFRVDF